MATVVGNDDWYLTAVDNALDAVILTDHRGLIMSWNKEAERVFGWAKEEVLGLLVVDTIVPSQHREAHSEGMKGFPSAGQGKKSQRCLVITALNRDGREFPVELYIIPFPLEEGGHMFISYIRDITERMEYEAGLREAMEEAGEAVKARAASKAKSEFLANMSHELRTPLNAIIGYSEMLSEEAEEMGEENFVQDLQKINVAGKHLLDLINDILDLSKIEAGKIQLYLETFSVGEMIQEVTNTTAPLAEKNKNRLVVDCPGDVGLIYADLTKTRQVLFNLLSNACKFTSEGRISLKVSRKRADTLEWFEFVITDNGIGMTPEEIQRLFQDFSQGDPSTTRRYGGTGLGLALSKRLCQAMGGDIRVESESGVGSIFTARLPAVVPEPNALKAVGSSGVKGEAFLGDIAERKTVLCIDDDPHALELLERYLSNAGYRVVTAGGGQEGLALAQGIHPDAITLDVMMPVVDGWAVLTAIKADLETANIPVVMITMTDDKSLGYSLGAAEFLSKPIERDRLLAVLNRLASRVPTKSILLVEDDLITRQMTRKMLEREGWAVLEAENGRVGLEIMEKNPPGAVVLDLMMPEMDGFAFAAEVAKGGKWSRIPIVVLTAKDITSEDRERLNGWVLEILQKGGYKREELLQKLNEALQMADA